MSIPSDSDASRADSENHPVLFPLKSREPIRIFLVDDHPAIRKVLASKVEDIEGLTVIGESARASEALSKIEDRRPDVAVVDISLGGVDGLTLTRNIRSEAPETRVLVFSMYEEPIYAKRSIRAGASGYLSKSEPIEEVLEAIKSISQGSIHLRQDVRSEILGEALRDGDTSGDKGLDAFTVREMTVFQMLGDGDTVAQIADRLDLSRKTVETYRRRAKKKLDCDSVRELIRYAVLWTSDEERLSSH